MASGAIVLMSRENGSRVARLSLESEEVFAIIQDKGRQYKVKQGDIIEMDRKNLAEGSTINFDNILFVDGKIGEPYVAGAKVTGVIKGEWLGKKLYIQKFKRRKNYRRRTGHRQRYTRVEITAIES